MDLFDIPAKENFAKGKALDLEQSSALARAQTPTSPAPRTGKTSAGADVLMITAGIPRKPGMSRDDLLNTNHENRESGSGAERASIRQTAS